LLAVLSAAVFGLLCVGAFVVYRHFAGAPEASPAAKATPASAARGRETDSATPSTDVLLKVLEVGGLRLLEGISKKPEVMFIVINHSQAALTDLRGTVTLRPSTSKPGSEAVGVFAFEHVSLGPFESRELRAPLKTSLRPYELPDWQFLRADLSIPEPGTAR
jgi:hypothetical protein